MNMYTEKKKYYFKGNLCYHYNYKNGKQHGNQKYYYYNGNLCYHSKCYNHKTQGIEIDYE